MEQIIMFLMEKLLILCFWDEEPKWSIPRPLNMVLLEAVVRIPKFSYEINVIRKAMLFLFFLTNFTSKRSNLILFIKI